MTLFDWFYVCILAVAILLTFAGLIACTGWTSARIAAALRKDLPGWIGCGLSFLSWTGFFAIGQALNGQVLNIEMIALFVLVPHLIIVAFGHHRFFKDTGL